MGRVTHHCFTPNSREACGVLVMFPIWWHYVALPELYVWVLVQSTMISYWQSTRTHWRPTSSYCPNILMSISHPHGESIDVDAQLCEVRWKETGVLSAAQGLCKGKGLFSLWRNVSPFLKIFLRFWRSIPYSITLEGLLCFCSFLLCLPRFLSARPIWSPDSQDLCICCCYSCI